MKAALLVVALLFASSAAQAKVSGGFVLSDPEYAGLWVSPYPDPQVSIDGRLTLSTVDVGLTGHIPISGTFEGGEHDLLVTGMVGWVHNLVDNHWLESHGAHFILGAGYGYQGNWDIRLIAGAVHYQGASNWSQGFTAMAMIGKFF